MENFIRSKINFENIKKKKEIKKNCVLFLSFHSLVLLSWNVKCFDMTWGRYGIHNNECGMGSWKIHYEWLLKSMEEIEMRDGWREATKNRKIKNICETWKMPPTRTTESLITYCCVLMCFCYCYLMNKHPHAFHLLPTQAELLAQTELFFSLFLTHFIHSN